MADEALVFSIAFAIIECVYVTADANSNQHPNVYTHRYLKPNAYYNTDVHRDANVHCNADAYQDAYCYPDAHALTYDDDDTDPDAH